MWNFHCCLCENEAGGKMNIAFSRVVVSRRLQLSRNNYRVFVPAFFCH